MSKPWRVVIVGGGFGGLNAAKALKSDLVDVTLIDRRNYHLFQPLLYQVATGSLSAGEIAAPLRSVLSKQKNTCVLLGTVEDVDPQTKQVFLADGAVLGGEDTADVGDLRDVDLADRNPDRLALSTLAGGLK